MGLSEPLLLSMLTCFSSLLLLLPFLPTLRGGIATSLIEYFCFLIMGSSSILGLAWGVGCLLLTGDLFHCSTLDGVDKLGGGDLHT
jgi:hypothetical protein